MGWQCKPQGGTIFMGKRDSHYVILLYWNFILSLIGYCKLFYRILPLFPILLLFYLFCICWDWQGQKCHLKCPKGYETNTELWYMVISACIHPCDTNTFTHSITRIYLFQLKTHNIGMKFSWNQEVFHLAIKEIPTLKSLYKLFSIKLSAEW